MSALLPRSASRAGQIFDLTLTASVRPTGRVKHLTYDRAAQIELSGGLR